MYKEKSRVKFIVCCGDGTELETIAHATGLITGLLGVRQISSPQ